MEKTIKAMLKKMLTNSKRKYGDTKKIKAYQNLVPTSTKASRKRT